ncbi:putative insertion sequence transposase protein [Rhizobium etli CFN 42]|uniref:Insertion sequence transposase protein n=2 Tax=Rhizobium etli TaxID=29449 RepID=Q2K6W0_RHIEC|nr:putative insertion sequence transposase protein [Rhizobium etli CFN 42]
MPVVSAGVDVSKEWLDVHLHPLGEGRRISNDKAGIGQLKRLLARHRPKSIVMEASSIDLPIALWLDGFAVAVVDPLRAHVCPRLRAGFLGR